MLNMTRCALAAVTLSAFPALAATQFGDHVTLSGFGTIGVTSADTDEAQFRNDLRQGRGAGKRLDFGVDSKLGLQANAQLNDTFIAVGQILVSRRTSNSVSMEWLYGQANLPKGFSVKLGRMVQPTFLVSDSRSVGFASHWLRAPQEIYAIYPPSSFDGGQLAYQSSFGKVNVTAQLSAGKAEAGVRIIGFTPTLKFDNLRSLNVVVETGDWLFRVGKTVADGALIGAPTPPDSDNFTGFGGQYDNGTAIVLAEYVTRRQSKLALFDSDGWYVSAGWRFGPWTPYMTLARFTPKGGGYLSRTADSTEALGLRWNAMPNLAIKAQVQNSRGSNINFMNTTPAFAAELPKVRVLSMAVDFVF